MSWELTNLGTLIDVLSGFAFDSKKFSDSNGKPLIRIRDIKRSYTETYYNGNFEEKYVVKSGDVLIGMDGEFNVAEWNGTDALLNQRVCKVTVKNPNHLDLRYLLYFLPYELKLIEDKASFVTVKHLSVNDVKNIQIPLPPIETQKRIAEILDAADAFRRKDQALLKKYDELAQAIFIDMFGDPVKNEKGWDVKKIGSITKVGSGSTPSRQNNSYFKGSIPWVKTTEVKGRIIMSTEEMISDEALKKSSCKLYPQNSVIIAMYGQGKTRGQVALLGIEATTNQACGVILPSSELNPKFLFNYLKLSYSELRNLGRGGNQENLNKGMIEDYLLMIPPIELQLKFNRFIDDLLNQKTSLKVDKSESLFNSLIQKAFNGELIKS